MGDPGMIVGLIADTHGLVRPDVAVALAGADLILHAGDVGGPGVLAALGRIAPVKAVMGNVDAPAPGLERELVLDLEGVRIHVSHGHELGSPTPGGLVARYDFDVIVYGHTHRALVERRGSRLVVNPGAAGPQRFHLPASVARLSLSAGRADVEIVPLKS